MITFKNKIIIIDWTANDVIDALEEYALIKQDELIEKIINRADPDVVVSNMGKYYLHFESWGTDSTTFSDWLKSLK